MQKENKAGLQLVHTCMAKIRGPRCAVFCLVINNKHLAMEEQLNPLQQIKSPVTCYFSPGLETEMKPKLSEGDVERRGHDKNV